MEGLRKDSAFCRLVAGCLQVEKFQLVDVGCLEGIDQGWRLFGDRLTAAAFDCDIVEIERLKSEEQHPGITYVHGIVGLPDQHPLRKKTSGKYHVHRSPQPRQSFTRTELIRQAARNGVKLTSLRDHLALTASSVSGDGSPAAGYDLDYQSDLVATYPGASSVPGGPILLPAELKRLGLNDVDFIKIDVDGPDFEILRSSAELLDNPGLLGVGLEVNFIGSHDANDHTFHNTDRFMRSKGFELFGLTTRQYSSAALPWPYRYAQVGVTAGGRPVQGDALYIRDLASPYCRAMSEAVSAEKLLKLAAIFSIAHLPDESAELLLAHEKRIGQIIDIEQALDLLALQIQENDGTSLSYSNYIAAFEAESPQFMDQDRRRQIWFDGLLANAAV